MGSSGLFSGNLATALILPTLVLATPLFDTGFVSLNRVLHGRSISQGGRDHTSHRLVLLGFTERRAVLSLYGITIWFGLIALWGIQRKDFVADGHSYFGFLGGPFGFRSVFGRSANLFGRRI